MLSMLPHNLRKARQKVAALYNGFLDLAPARRSARLYNTAQRVQPVSLSSTHYREQSSKRACPYARVLIDGQWDNANYWFRYALLRRALGLASRRGGGTSRPLQPSARGDRI